MNSTPTPTPYQTSEILSARIGRHYRKRILTTIACVGIVVSFCYAATLWFVYQNLYSGMTDTLYALAYLWSLRWIHQGKYTLSAYWIIFWGGVQITSGSILFVGPETGFQLYFLTLPVMVYFLLSRQPAWARACVMVYGCLLFVASHTFHVDSLRAPIPPSLSNIIFICNAFIVFGIIFVAVTFFAEEIERAYRDQNKLVLTDSLTGLSNARFIAQHAQKLFSLCDRYGHPLSLIVMDIDHFKRLNARHGRKLCDQMLVHVATLLKQDIRDADILARIGGDEFLMILPETVLTDANDIAKRLQERVRDHPLVTDQGEFRLGISLGTSFCDSNAMATVDELIGDASARLSAAQPA